MEQPIMGCSFFVLGGGSTTNPNETVNISLTQVGGSSSDLIGATITITDDDDGSTLFTATWNGGTITTAIEMFTNYTVSVETIAGYLACAPQTYQAGYYTTKNISFQYKALGTYIEATDGTLYTSSEWTNAGKVANSIVVLADIAQFKISLTIECRGKAIHKNDTDPLETFLSSHPTAESELLDFDGYGNTQKILNFNNAYGSYSTDYAAPCANAFTFPNGEKNAYIPSTGEFNLIVNNYTAIETCLSACNGTAMGRTLYFTSTFCQVNSNSNNTRTIGYYRGTNNGVGTQISNTALNCRLIAKYPTT